jgi:hypothetical protein
LPVIQFSLFGGAAFVSYTRISNYKHHWSDVLTGAILGSAIGIVNVSISNLLYFLFLLQAIYVAKLFKRREIPPGVKRGNHYQMDDVFAPQQPAYIQQPTEIIIDGSNGQQNVQFNRRDGGNQATSVIQSTRVVQSTAPQPQEVRYSSLMTGASSTTNH